jgi:hypothetical protein
MLVCIASFFEGYSKRIARNSAAKQAGQLLLFEDTALDDGKTYIGAFDLLGSQLGPVEIVRWALSHFGLVFSWPIAILICLFAQGVWSQHTTVYSLLSVLSLAFMLILSPSQSQPPDRQPRMLFCLRWLLTLIVIILVLTLGTLYGDCLLRSLGETP